MQIPTYSGINIARYITLLMCAVICLTERAPIATAQPANAQATPPTIAAPKLDAHQSQSSARMKRIDAWLGAWHRGVSRAVGLSNQQSEALSQHLAKAASANQARWRRLKQESTIPDTAVHWFMGYMGPAWQLSRAFDFHAERSLSPTQWTGYTSWRERHNQRVARFFAQRAVAVMHADLFLTPEQRATCEAIAVDWNQPNLNGVFLLRRPNQIASAKPLRQLIVQLPDQLLTFNQRARLDYIRDSSAHFKLTRHSTPSSVNRRIADINQKCAADCLNAVAVRVDYLATMLQLSTAQERKLELAGKGAVRRLRQSWRNAAENVAARLEREEPEGIMLQLPVPEHFALDDLWANTLIQLDREAAATQDSTSVAHRGAVGLVMGILDQELLLDEGQIEPLQQLVRQTKPERVGSNATHMPEIAMVARTLVRINDKAVARILAPPQQQCWQQIREGFRFDGQTRASIRWMTPSPNLILTESAS